MAYNPFGIEDDDPIYQEELAKLQASYKPKAVQKQNKGFLGDTATGLKIGVEQLPGVVTGLADIAASPISAATGVNRPFSRAADWLGEATGFRPGEWAKQAEAEYSPQYQEAARNVQAAKGFLPTLGALAENPRYAFGTVAESLPSMAAGWGVGGAAAKGLMGAERIAALRAAAATGDVAAQQGLTRAGMLAAGIGEGSVTAGQQMQQLDYNTDPLRAAGTSLAAGVGTGLIGAASGRLANKLGVTDVDQFGISGLARQEAGQGWRGLSKRIGAGVLTEGFFEELPQSMQEQIWNNIANGKPWDQGVAEQGAIGLVAGGLMGGGINAFSRGYDRPAAAPQTTNTPEPAPSDPPVTPTNLLALPAPTETLSLPTNLADGNADLAGETEATRANDEMWKQRDAQAFWGDTPIGETRDMFGNGGTNDVQTADPEQTLSTLMQQRETLEGVLGFVNHDDPAMVPTIREWQGDLNAVNESIRALMVEKQTTRLEAGSTQDMFNPKSVGPLPSVDSFNAPPRRNTDGIELRVTSDGTLTTRPEAPKRSPVNLITGEPVANPQATLDLSAAPSLDPINQRLNAQRGADRMRAVARAKQERGELLTAYEAGLLASDTTTAPLELPGKAPKLELPPAPPTERETAAKRRHKVVRDQARLSKVLGYTPTVNATPVIVEAEQALAERQIDKAAFDQVVDASARSPKNAAAILARAKQPQPQGAVDGTPTPLDEASDQGQRAEPVGSVGAVPAVSEQPVRGSGSTGAPVGRRRKAKPVGDGAGGKRVEEPAVVTQPEQVVEEAPQADAAQAEAQPAAAPKTEVVATGNTARDIVRSHDIETDEGVTAALRDLMKNENVPYKIAATAEDAVDFIETSESDLERAEETAIARNWLRTVGEHRTQSERKQTTKGTVAEVPRVGSLAEQLGANKFSEGQGTGVQASKLANTLKKLFFSPEKFDKLVTVVQSARELKPQDYAKLSQADDPSKVYGFTSNGRVVLIADNIPAGKELAVFLHEAGVHLGMEKLIGKANMERLAAQIEKWAAQNDGSQESELAKKAVARAKESSSSTEFLPEENIAYFIEEAVAAGIDPYAVEKMREGALKSWFRTLWAAAKVALRKIGLMRFEQLTAQNLVDLAYGAAKLEMTGTWHGTAADFRNFNHAYMGSGEGAQAFGWGTYLAQRTGIAKGYWKSDISRKTKGGWFATASGYPITEGALVRELTDLVKNDPDFDIDTLKVIQRNWSETLAKWSGRPEFYRDAIRLQYALTELEDAIADGGITYLPRTQPEGSLMRVDTAVHDDEMLDWDKPLSAQSEVVKEALATAPRGKQLHTAMGSGEGLYKQLVRGLGSDKAASEYLDSIGIKGIKFLDSMSRGNAKAYDNYPRAYALNDAIAANDMLGFDSRADVRAMLMQDGLEAAQQNYDMSPDLVKEAKAWLDWLAAPVQETRNLVIFNDKNVQRVATEVGASKDKIKFSQAGTASAKASEFRIKWGENIKDVLRRGVLATIPLDQLVRMFEPGENGEKSFGDYLRDYQKRMNEKGAAARKYIESVRPLGEKWTKLGAAEGAKLSNALTTATLQEAWGDVAFEHADNAHLRSTDPDLLAENRKAYNEARDAYNALTNEAKELYRPVLSIGSEWLKKEYTLRGRAARDAYLPLIQAQVDASTFSQLQDAYTNDKIGVADTRKVARALLKGNPKALELVKEMDAMIDEQIGRMREMQGPYFPLMRFGEYLTVYKSKDFSAKLDAYAAASQSIKQYRADNFAAYDEAVRELRDAQIEHRKRPTPANKAAMDTAKKTVADLKDSLKAKQDELNKLKGANAKAFKELAQMATEEKHYIFEKHESSGAAKLRAEQLGRQFTEGDIVHMASADYLNDALPTSRAFVNKLEARFKQRFGANTPQYRAAVAALNTTFLETTHDRSSLKRMFLQRKKVPGYSREGQRVFASFAMQGAHRLSSIEHFVEMQTALDEAAKEAHRQDRTDSGRLTQVSNEVLRRFEIDMKYNETPVMDWITKLNHTWTLGVSPAYLLQNLSQTHMVSTPMIAARHGLGKSVNAVWKAWSDSYKIISDAVSKQGGRYTVDIDALNLSDGEKKMLKDLFHAGLADILQEHDIGEVASGNETALKVNKAIDKINWISRQIELHNRLTTSLAAYRLENARTNDQEAASRYAQNVVSDTQINYSDENASRWLKKNAFFGAKLLGQFKKYQIGMATTVAMNAKKAFAGDKEALRATLGILSTHLVMTGSMGLSLYFPAKVVISTLAGILGLAGDDDEPFDFDRWYKNWVADVFGKELGDVITRGIPTAAGLDFSGSLGQGNLFNPLPFYRGGDDTPKALWQAIAPPALGTMSNIYKGVNKMMEGEYVEGLALATPRYISAIPKAYKLDTVGITTKEGNVRVPAEQFDTADIVMQGLGLPLVDVRKYYERENDFFELRTNQTKVKSQLLKEWSETGERPDGVDRFNAKYPDARLTFKDVLAQRKKEKAYAKQVTDEGLRASKKQQTLVGEIRY